MPNHPSPGTTDADAPPPAHVAIVEDDRSVADSLAILLEAYGYAASAYASGAAFLAERESPPPGFLIVDYRMPDMTGLDLVARLQGAGLAIPTVVITGRLEHGVGERARGLGVLATLEKPFSADCLLDLIHSRCGTS